MFIYVVALPMVVILAAVMMLWPTHLSPLWNMYRAGVFTWADEQGITLPRLAMVGAGAAAAIAVVAAIYVLLFVTVNPLAVVSTLGVVAGAPALALALIVYRSLTVSVWVWFNDGSEFGGRITSRQPLQDWHTADPQLWMPTNRGESIWLYAGDVTDLSELADTATWQDFKALDFLATGGQNSSLFFARCDTSPLIRASNRRNKKGVKAETIKAGIILAFAGLFGLLGFLGMTAANPVP